MKLVKNQPGRLSTSIVIGLIGMLVTCVAHADHGGEVSFTQMIRPMLSDKCFHCHGNDENTQEAGLRLDVREAAIEMEAIVPRDADASLAYQRMLSDDDDEVMPPPHSHKSLSDEEKETFRRWIEAGAVYEQHWSYRSVDRPEVPDSISPSPIDAFVQRELQQLSLPQADPADRPTLVRRLSLDLTGLPPTPEEVRQFLDDSSENAYERLVDRLLAKPAYGERMATFWLDLVRYADTVGYHADNAMEVSAYRDYVIKAFNENKPFDEFTIEQLAGDLLPDSTLDQKIASGYNRLLQTTAEGGAQPKEYIAIYAADRVRNVSGVWMGQTMGCAQCHDHKYDPITAKDFYAMSAFFADIREKPVGKREKNLVLLSDEERVEISRLQTIVDKAKETEARFLNGDVEAGDAQKQWESKVLKVEAKQTPMWRVPKPSAVQVDNDGDLRKLGDGSLLSTGILLDQSEIKLTIESENSVAAIRLEALTDDSFPVKGSFSRGNGNFILTDFEVILDGKQIEIAKAKADFAQDGWPAKHAIDDDSKTGWAVAGHYKAEGRRVVVFTLKNSIDVGASESKAMQIILRHQSVHKKHNIDRFRISVASEDSNSDGEAEDSTYDFDGTTEIPAIAREVIALSDSERTEEQRQFVRECYLQHSPERLAAAERIAATEDEIKSIRENARTMLVAEATKPRMTRLLDRGNWMDETGEIIEPAVPDFLSWETKPEGRRATRLDLAKWILEPTNPLTARTFVNRLWKLYFGRGISDNVDDLGGQGEPPTHPELLDWLAVEFREGGWNVKRMTKLIVITDTYRQRSVPSSLAREVDPGNQWYARQGRWRIEAEFVRDTALQLSGLLKSEIVGGRSVKPYQPKGYWQHLNFPKRKWEQDKGEKLYRRSLYTFWCRSFLHPSMVAFDAPSREECTAKRSQSNIPQQALVLLNDPAFVEASRVFAQRIMAFEGDATQKIAKALSEAVNREATDDEVILLADLLDAQQQRFADAKDEALALTSVGESPVPQSLDRQELAAWTQVARAILNAYETISRH